VESFNIHPARAEDLDAILILQDECHLSGWSRQAYMSELERSDSVMLVARAEAENKPVGFIVGRISRLGGPDSRAEADIYNIGTGPEVRERGVGSALMTEFLKSCRTSGVRKIWLEARISNVRAIKFYTARGFVRVRIRKGFYSDPVEDAAVMMLDLS
jgi:ribosomal-protein-alanine N-acetyltransferase